MRINEVEFNCSLQDILDELVLQLRANNIPYIQKMKPTSRSIQISCPYHSDGMERRPSAGIRKEDGLFHCFACQEVHSLPEVITHCFGYDQDILGVFGWKWLLKNFATIQVEERKDVELDLERNKDNRKYRHIDFNVDTGEHVNNNTGRNGQEFVPEEELNEYRYIHQYMYERKLTDDIIELFDVGYDKKTACITFPVRDIYGNCLFVARRSVRTKYFNYPAGTEKPLYGIYELELTFPDWNKTWPDIIVCESIIDALTCWVYGKYAIALNGLGSENQFKELMDLPCRKLILATDMDEAGLRAREIIRKNVPHKIITEYIWDRSMAKDINDMTKEQFNQLEEIF